MTKDRKKRLQQARRDLLNYLERDVYTPLYHMAKSFYGGKTGRAFMGWFELREPFSDEELYNLDEGRLRKDIQRVVRALRTGVNALEIERGGLRKDNCNYVRENSRLLERVQELEDFLSDEDEDED